jgi:hypothetical protein
MQPRKEKQLRKKTKKHEPKREQAYEKTDNEMGEVATEQVVTWFDNLCKKRSE